MVFQFLQAWFFDRFIDLCLADVLAFVDLVNIRFGEFGHPEGMIDFLVVSTEVTLAVDSHRFDRLEALLIVFERLIATRSALDVPVVPLIASAICSCPASLELTCSSVPSFGTIQGTVT